MSDVVVTYRLETPADPIALANKIASDQSTGTFTELPGETADLKARCAARVLNIRELPSAALPSWPSESAGNGPFRRAEVDIAFPLEVMGTDLAALMTIALGGPFSIKGMTGLRVVDLQLPPEFVAAHPGPQFGIEGTRQLTGVRGRPLIGTIIKPNLGLSPSDIAAITRELVDAGVDFIKDDEKMMNPGYAPLADRVAAVMPVLKDHEQRTGRRVMYAFGLSSADPDLMLRHHDLIADAGGTGALVNINSVGFAGMNFLRKRSRLAIHAHRNGWDLLTRHPGIGFDFGVYQTLWRLAGVDQFQINGIGAKYWEPDDSFVRSFAACMKPLASLADRVMPVVCSGQWGGQAPETFARTGQTIDLLYLGGGGIIGHPGGPGAGVRAISQAWQAAVQGIPLEVFARDHRELAESLKKWGNRNTDGKPGGEDAA
ncbi:MAG: 3-oxo-isoapionate-4-phosphate decarboxylase OiaX [Deltaproteobacteria bacterium]|nr:3-oxo-isoapionate-4-phosphate decarboxylase OiaX [Deltaproteobacteria bacterium]